MVNEQTIPIEVVYARPEKQVIVPLKVLPGCTVEEAIQQSGLLQEYAEINLAECKVGVYGQLCDLDMTLLEGDRVEIYRPIVIDPKEARRLRVG